MDPVGLARQEACRSAQAASEVKVSAGDAMLAVY